MKLILIFCLLLGAAPLWAFDTGQQIFRPDVRSLQVYNPDDFMAPPIIRMGSSDRLNINFDIISDDYDYLRYRLIHCNADWQPSRLMESEYIDGFNEAEIEDFAFSSNTYIHYVNYNISIPDPSLPILKSGNYLLQVYPENDPDEVLLQARFSVSEEKSHVSGYMSTRTDRGVNNEYQQLFLSSDFSALGEVNPYQDLIIVITQNNDPVSMRALSHPIRVENGKAVFEHDPLLIFEAGNEYRRFETVRADYPGMHVDSVRYIDGIWHAWLQTDVERFNKEYVYDSTQHGRFKIDEYNSSDPDLSADYIMVHFTLDPASHPNGAVFLDGNFTNHQFSDETLMKYDWQDGLYHASMPLKQGSYNYKYIVVPEKGIPSSRSIEGNKFETNNEYLVQVFYRPPGVRGDRMVGAFTIR